MFPADREQNGDSRTAISGAASMTAGAFFKTWRMWFPQHDANTYVYAIQAGEDGPVKIGTALRPWERLATLQTANPVRLRGVAVWWGSQREERVVHELFADRRLEGEWFKPTDDLLWLVDLLGGGPSCDFHRPSSCFWNVDSPKLPGVCQACDMQFFA